MQRIFADSAGAGLVRTMRAVNFTHHETVPFWNVTALVFSAGGLWAAWEVGAWSVLRERFRPDLIVGASAGAWNGWAIAGGCTPQELKRMWLDPSTGGVMRFGLHATGFLQGAPLRAKARDLFDRFQPRVPFALTIVELPRLRSRIVRDRDIRWQHLAACLCHPVRLPAGGNCGAALRGWRIARGTARFGPRRNSAPRGQSRSTCSIRPASDCCTP